MENTNDADTAFFQHSEDFMSSLTLPPELCQHLIPAALVAIEFVPEWIRLIIILVVLFSLVEFSSRNDLGDNWLCEPT